MLKKKYVVYPGVPATGIGTWAGDTEDDDQLNDKVKPLFCYSDYNEKNDEEKGCWHYDVANDWHGP